MCNRRIPQCKHFFYDLQYQPLFPLYEDETLPRRPRSGGEDDAQMQCSAAGCTLEKPKTQKEEHRPENPETLSYFFWDLQIEREA